MSKRQITLADLARHLRLSPATVSRALKNYPDISQDTKNRVNALAKEWNYRPNSIAAGLRKRESKIIGVIIPEIVDHYFSAIIKGIMEVVYDADYRVMLCQSDEAYDKEKVDAAALLDSRVDGLLVSIAHTTYKFDHFLDFLNTGTPVVMFDKVTDQVPGCSRITVDDRAGAFTAVQHLIDQGYRRIAILTGPQLAYTALKREQGYKDALAANNLTFDESLMVRCMDVTYSEGQQYASHLLQCPNPPDAFFGITDNLALGALTACKQLGVKVPEQVGVAGFSNWLVGDIVEPSLTSVSQPGATMGRLAANILLEEIKSIHQDITPAPQYIELKTDLVVRKSSSRIS